MIWAILLAAGESKRMGTPKQLLPYGNKTIIETVILSSVQKGFSSLPIDAGAVLVFLGDQPMVPSSVIDQIINTYRSTEKGIVLPVFDGARGHPVLIDTKYKREVAAIDPEIGLRELIHKHPEDILEVDVETSTIIEDIDTPEDYKKLKG